MTLFEETTQITNPVITAERLAKSYGSIRAVDGVDLSILGGECFGLLGPNGAGKSTTINMLVGLTVPDRGSVTVCGDSPLAPLTRNKIGAAPQALSLYEELTARENLVFFAQLYGLSGRLLRERVDWALGLADLRDRSRHRVSTFSGGMKRRLNIAVALVHDPQVILLDEPTVGVDPQSRNYIFETIERLKSNGLTILYTTHYMEEAQRLCDRVAIMDQGRILAEGPVAELLKKHGGNTVVIAHIEHCPPGVDLPGRPDEDGSHRFESERPFAELAQLTASGVRFLSVQVNQPDLESVFLSLTGKSLRD